MAKKYRVKVFGELDDLRDTFDDLPEGVRLLGEAEGGWTVEFAVEAPDEEAMFRAANDVAETLKFDLGQWSGIDPVEFA